jgi:hypothetical protein
VDAGRQFDRYLRRAENLLCFASGEVLVVSEREANALCAAVWAVAPPVVVRVSLLRASFCRKLPSPNPPLLVGAALVAPQALCVALTFVQVLNGDTKYESDRMAVLSQSVLAQHGGGLDRLIEVRGKHSEYPGSTLCKQRRVLDIAAVIEMAGWKAESEEEEEEQDQDEAEEDEVPAKSTRFQRRSRAEQVEAVVPAKNTRSRTITSAASVATTTTKKKEGNAAAPVKKEPAKQSAAAAAAKDPSDVQTKSEPEPAKRAKTEPEPAKRVKTEQVPVQTAVFSADSEEEDEVVFVPNKKVILDLTLDDDDDD